MLSVTPASENNRSAETDTMLNIDGIPYTLQEMYFLHLPCIEEGLNSEVTMCLTDILSFLSVLLHSDPELQLYGGARNRVCPTLSLSFF